MRLSHHLVEFLGGAKVGEGDLGPCPYIITVSLFISHFQSVQCVLLMQSLSVQQPCEVDQCYSSSFPLIAGRGKAACPTQVEVRFKQVQLMDSRPPHV